VQAVIPEIRETGEDKKLKIKDLKEKYTKYAYLHFIRQPPLVLLYGNLYD
jgi:hypothetical protein